MVGSYSGKYIPKSSGYRRISVSNGYNVFLGWVISTMLVASSCASIDIIEETTPSPITDEEWILLDGPVQELRELTWDLHHQKLRVRFDFEREKVIGHTELLLTSEREQSELVLDAKTMEFDSLYHIPSGRNFAFYQDSATVTLQFDSTYAEGDTLIVGIDYVATPPERGLYFVDPRGEDPAKPSQIWTLGQPEDNSFWFPTIDHPAERATQETWISVPSRFSTLSNGQLMESRITGGDSLRTDYWRLNQPHAPYLFALAVGEYEITEEIRDDLLYRYYTESEFTEMVDKIYQNTVDMLQFSEEKTGRAFPWDPVYAQAPVHDFIANGMENTTATLLYDGVQFDQRASRDLSNQNLVMHELIHQWLGNLVTAKNWANLPLNEGFANYFEAIYRLHNDGKDSYLWKIQDDRISYFEEAREYRRPVIFDRYRVPEDMYDRHTYQKSGQILRMLHDYIGDDRWWKGVETWVDKFSYDAVDVHDLQRVYEDVTDEDLSWFFEQWFHEPGHPYLDIYREILDNRAVLSITQIQDTTRQPVYTLYPEVLVIFEDGSTAEERIEIDDIQQEIVLDFNKPVSDVIVDPDRVQLAEYYLTLDDATLMRRTESDHLLIRSEAIAMLSENMQDSAVIQDRIGTISVQDPFWGIRLQAFELLGDHTEMLPQDEILSLLEYATYDNEKNYRVRREALELLRNMDFENAENRERVRKHLRVMLADISYFVSAEAIRLTGEIFPGETAAMVSHYADRTSYQNIIRNAVSEALMHSESRESRDLMKKLAEEPGNKEYSYRALEYLADLIRKSDSGEEKALKALFIKRLDDPYARYRMLAYDVMVELGATDQLEKLYRLRERNDLDQQERQKLKDTIRALEYDLEYEK